MEGKAIVSTGNTMLKYIILICLFFIACQKNPAGRSAKPLILVSVAPYKSLTKQIAGDEFDVATIVPAAANPHSFEPTASQVIAVSQGAVLFTIGESFEGKIIPILKKRNSELAVVDLRKGIELIDGESGLGCSHCGMDHLDRHVWLSPRLMSRQAETIAKALGEKFPEKKEEFQKNLVRLQENLISLDREIEEILKGVANRTILVSHPAFGYFCKEYNLKQLSVEYEGKEPRPRHLEEILNRAVTESMGLALALPQYNNKGAQLIAEKLHIPIRMIDPYSSEYFETMRKLAQLIADSYAD
jgi:zinc transport system substrate-binding protein